MQRIKQIILIVSLSICLVACQKRVESTIELTAVEEMKQTSDDTVSETIFVHVCGAVQKEGVYELPVGSRAYEAIQKAGGFAKNAASAQMNQAQVLQDAAQLYVPTTDEVLTSQTSESGKVNINRASEKELMTLPGIGEAKAESIVRYRESNGTFQKIEDIMKIPGIKEALFEKIKDSIQI